MELRADQSIAVVLRSLPLAAACRRLPLAAGRPPQMEDEDYVVAAAAGAAGTRGVAVRHREWRAERIGALCHRVAVSQGLGDGERGGGADEAGAAFKWKWNIDDGNSSRNASARHWGAAVNE